MIKNIALADILPPKIDARFVEDEDLFTGLVESIKHYGLIEPIVLRDLGEGKYEIIVGSRRVLAASTAGMGKIPAVICRCDDEQAEAMRLEENIQRKDLSPVDIARYIEKIMKEYKINQAEVARRLRRSPAYVTQMLDLLHKDPIIRDMVEKEEIPYSVGRELLRIPIEETRHRFARYAQKSGANISIVKGWTNRELSDLNRKAGDFHEPEPVPVDIIPVTSIITHPCVACGRIGPLDAMVIFRTCPDCGQMLEQVINQGVFNESKTTNNDKSGDRGSNDNGISSEASNINKTNRDA